MTRLPSELRLGVSRKFGDSESWNFKELLKLIETEVQAREWSSASGYLSERQHKDLPTGATLLTDTWSPQCCFCQREHPPQNCQAITGIESRWEVLKKTGRCYIHVCLRKGHLSRSCQSRIKFLNCKGMLQSVQPWRALNSKNPNLNLNKEVDWTHKLQRINWEQATCGPMLASKSYYRPYRWLRLTLTIHRRVWECVLWWIQAVRCHT